MKKKNRLKKCLKICFIFIAVIVVFNCSATFAAINNEYSSDTATVDITDETIKNNLVLDYIGQFIFAIGNICQSVVSWIFGILTGKSAFPWADMTIFNTVPLLDVNFINPDAGSFFSDTEGTGIGAVIRSVYFTGLSLSLGFLGVVIGAMAIKLALSTIASDKAKYKEALIKWATSLVLLFSMHYVLAFLFYMNEEMVVVASRILSGSLSESGEKINAILSKDLDENKKTIVDNFIKSVEGKISSEDKKYLQDNYQVTYLLLNNETFRNSLDYVKGSDKTSLVDHLGRFGSGILEGITFGNYDSPEEQQVAFLVDCTNIVASGVNNYKNYYGDNGYVEREMAKQEGKSLEQLRRTVAVRFAISNDLIEQFSSLEVDENGAIPTSTLLKFMTDNGGEDISGYNEEQCKDSIKNYVTKNVQNIQGNGSLDVLNKEIEEIKNMSGLSGDEKDTANALLVALDYAVKANKGELDVNSLGTNLISNLGEYFKQTAWSIDIDNDGWAPTQVSIICAILYTIFIFQSVGFFVSYVKRLFIVVVLAVLAPVVVIYDFFTKSVLSGKSNVFSSWLRELCSLIFVQTFHAFLLAIIMSIIVGAVSSSYLSTIDGGIEAVGLLAIFALLSLPKLELLVKNIFGLTSGVADTSLAAGQKSSFVGSMLAYRAGKRLLDNPRKVVGGIGKSIGAQFNIRKAKNAKNDYLIGQKESDEETPKRKISGARGSISAVNSVGNGTTSELTSAIKQLTREINKQSLDTGKGKSDSKLNELDKAIEDAKKQRTEGLKSIATGTLETVGALHGAVAGATIGAATNNNVADYAIKGAGLGDAAGETIVNLGDTTINAGRALKSGVKAEVRAHTGDTKTAYKKLERELKDKNSNSMKDLNDKISMYAKSSSKNQMSRPKNKIDDVN